MKEIIREAVANSNTLNDVKEHLFDVFRATQKEGHTRLGYVAGIITSEGPENIGRNIKRLATFTEQIRSQNDFPIFSSTDVFDDKLFARLDANGFKNSDWEVFWREVLKGDEKSIVTDIFMTPRWEISHGSQNEHKTAQEVGIKIHYFFEEI